MRCCWDILLLLFFESCVVRLMKDVKIILCDSVITVCCCWYTLILLLFSRSDPPERLLSYLWPFFHHALPSVREAALSTAITMLNGEAEVTEC